MIKKKIISKIGDYRQPLPETVKEPLLDFMESEEIKEINLDDYEEFNPDYKVKKPKRG